ncbi:MAG TPA: hypothetical protein VFK82_02605 [Burkholderiaceae bacterium]|nr:hypothetical protein [Burkholderiaceae bacterium]
MSAALAGMSLLAACAALPDSPRVEVDQQKVGQIERTARERGVQVMWFHYPTRVVESRPAAAPDPGQPPAPATGR